jgi:hypothetical protein
MATTNKSFRVKSGLTVEGGALYPAAGTTSIAPIVLTSGTNLTTATAGAFEFDGTNFYLTPASTRKTIAFLDSNITGSAGSVANAVTFATSGGATSGTTFNGSAAKTIDYSTLGAAPLSHTHGNITNAGAIGSTSGLVIVTTTSGVLTALAAGTSGQFLGYNGAWATPTDTNYYPTALTYTDGTTAGPVATIAMSGASNITASAIPAASGTVSGVVTTGAQTFAGTKTLTSPSIATSLTTASTSFDLVNTTATTVNFAGAGTAVGIGASTGNTTVNNNLVVTGNLTVNGTTNTINSTTITVDDKNIELGSVASPTDTTADGGGITLKGATDKTLNWVNATDAWTSSEHLDLASGKALYIAGTSVLNATTLGSAVVNSSITKVGALSGGTAGFVKVDASGNLTSDSTTYLTSSSPSLTGTVTYNSTAATITISDSTTGTTAKTVSSVFASTAYKGVEILVKGTNGSNIEIVKALAIFDGTNVYITQYGEVFTSANLFDIDFTYTTTNVNFVFTPVAGTTGTTSFNAVLTLLAA